MDSHTPRTSHTGRLHGMPLAWLLGQDDDLLYGLSAGGRLGVRVFHIEEVNARGLDAVFAEAVRIATTGTEGFGISVDLDVVTPDEAPGVGTPVAGGIRGDELARALATVGGRPDMLAVELVEYAPRLDPDGRSAQVAIETLAAALCGPRDQAEVLAHAVQGNDS
jgi:arginase family enzyme